MRSFLWKVSQLAVFLGYYYLMNHAYADMEVGRYAKVWLASALIALALTAITFAPIMWITGRFRDTGCREAPDAQSAEAEREGSLASGFSGNPALALKALHDRRQRERRLRSKRP